MACVMYKTSVVRINTQDEDGESLVANGSSEISLFFIWSFHAENDCIDCWHEEADEANILERASEDHEAYEYESAAHDIPVVVLTEP